MTKPRSKAAINAVGEALIPRHMGRIRTLKGAIEKAEGRLNKVREGLEDRWTEADIQSRITSLKGEISRRRESLIELKSEIDAALEG